MSYTKKDLDFAESLLVDRGSTMFTFSTDLKNWGIIFTVDYDKELFEIQPLEITLQILCFTLYFRK